MAARGMPEALLVLLLVLSGLRQRTTSAGRSDQRHSYLREFIAMRREIFPLSSDVQRRRHQAPPATVVTSTAVDNTISTNSNNYNYNNRPSIRQIRHSGSTLNSQQTAPNQQIVLQTRQLQQQQPTPYYLPDFVYGNSRPAVNKDKDRGRKINVQSTNALLWQYTNTNQVNEYKPVRPTNSLDSTNVNYYRNDSSNGNIYPNINVSSITVSPSVPTTLTRVQIGQLLSTDQILAFLKQTHPNFTRSIEKPTKQAVKVTPPKQRVAVTERPTVVNSSNSLFDTVLASLRRIPILGEFIS